MAPRKKSGRASAEAAYAELMKDSRALIGNVGETYETLTSKLDELTDAHRRYEEARAAAVKGAGVTSDQLDAMGYPRPFKLPNLTPPAEVAKTAAKPSTPSSSAPKAEGGADPDRPASQGEPQ